MKLKERERAKADRAGAVEKLQYVKSGEQRASEKSREREKRKEEKRKRGVRAEARVWRLVQRRLWRIYVWNLHDIQAGPRKYAAQNWNSNRHLTAYNYIQQTLTSCTLQNTHLHQTLLYRSFVH